jgi:hypothetical protein
MVENVTIAQSQITQYQQPERQPQLIEAKDIKAILYLGLRGEITLPIEEHEVDILA